MSHLSCDLGCFSYQEHSSHIPTSHLYFSFGVCRQAVQRMGPLSAFTHSHHTSVDPANKGIVWGPACCCTTPIVTCMHRDSGFRNHSVLWGEVIGLMPSPQHGGPGFFCRGFPSLSHRFRLFEDAEHLPFATVDQLLATASITRGYENKDV